MQKVTSLPVPIKVHICLLYVQATPLEIPSDHPLLFDLLHKVVTLLSFYIALII